ncbi:MAG TPA: hypothetical protein ENJ95_03845 [Bacteroidetes bacterium]|nr:hypothetical protein [Bacteroidota bacterium]
MKNISVLFLSLSLFFAFCGNTDQPIKAATKVNKISVIDTNGMTVRERFLLPEGFERVLVAANSFQHYLRNLPLKPAASKVYLFNGHEKYRQDVHAAVVDMDVGSRDLQQCADAVMRLRAEYLFSEKKYGEIHFDFTNGFNAAYKKWREGSRISVKGNTVKWVSSPNSSTSYNSFRKYMDMVFAYAGTWSLAKEMKPTEPEKMEIGNVFIKGGSPGHAVIVVDMAVNKKTGKKIFLLAQSYMPAQDIHILKNPNKKGMNAWYDLDFGEILNTPEWRFQKNELKRF